MGFDGNRERGSRSPRAIRRLFDPRPPGAIAVAAALALALTPVPALAQSIGVASSVVREVTGTVGGNVRQLAVGAGVFADETIQTGPRSNSQLMFRDETTLSIGPSSAVVLDRFVYNPGGTASTFSVEAARGALRFVSGSSSSSAYSVSTPVATIGVRGTILDIFVRQGFVIVILTEGAADVCVGGRRTDPERLLRRLDQRGPTAGCTGLVRPGSYIIVYSGGRLEGPLNWDGRLQALVGPVSFPLYGWNLFVDRRERFDTGQAGQLGAVDQLQTRETLEPDGSGIFSRNPDTPFEPDPDKFDPRNIFTPPSCCDRNN